ncbi:MAG: bifunctional diguanylate cyclase/phosphodiesterase [Armatimonadetes bacterium]|nr:bifunctional diguanylate cyclase/phosphodiesterase [Armatimonadota bacterium]
MLSPTGIVQFVNGAAESVLGSSGVGRPLSFVPELPRVRLASGDGREHEYLTQTLPTTWGGNYAKLILLRRAEGKRPQRRVDELEKEVVQVRGELAEARKELVDVLQRTPAPNPVQAVRRAASSKKGLADPLHPIQSETRTEADLERLAFEDRLTGLANLNILEQYLELACARAKAGEGTAALLVLDLDRFHNLNQTVGQETGDRLLRQVAERLRTIVGDRGVLARRGEDEFMSVLFHPSQSKDADIHNAARLLSTQMLRCLDAPLDLEGGESVSVQASIGVSFCPLLSENARQMFEQADAALFMAKRTGRNRYKFYTNDFHQQREKRRQKQARISEAWQRREFLVHYQPIVDLETGQMAGLEALLRWSHPAKGTIEPRNFMEGIHDSGLLSPIGDWVLAQACEAAGKIHKKQFICVNLEVRQLIHPGFVDRFFKIVQSAGVRAEQLVVELSEGRDALTETAEALERLQHWGVRIGVDDFGTGSTSVTRLHSVKPTFLKIDRNFVERLPHDRGGCGICLAVMGLAASVESKTIAVGVETEEQCVYLRQYGCDYGQGHYFCEPVPAGKLHALSGHSWTLKGKRMKAR